MKKKNLKNKLSLKVKDISALTGEEANHVKGGVRPTLLGCDPCETRSCIDGGYSCGQFPCQSQALSIAEC